MSIVDSLKETYYSVEDKWYKLVDSISEKVPAFGSIVDAIEDKGIPSFPVAIVLVLLIVIGLFFLLTGSAASTISLTVLDSSNNPLETATVIVMQNGATVKEDYTNAEGKISFVLANGTYSIKAVKDNYTSSTKSILVEKDDEDEFVLSLEDTKVTRAVYLKTANGDLITGYGRVFYRCKSGTDTETKDTDYSNGKFNAELNESCSEVEVISLENYSLLNAIASFSGNGAVTVERVEVSTGGASVTISVASSTETIPAGIRVKLVPIDGTVPLETLTTGTNVVLFSEVNAKTYYVLVQDLTGNYQTYNGSTIADNKEVKRGEITQFTAVLTKTPSSTITLSVKDLSTGLPVKSAEVKLSSIENSEDYQTKITGATGQLTFNVSQGNTFVITVDHPEYLIGETTSAQAGNNLTINLTKADSTNSNSLLVRVVDAKKNPVDNVRVTLKTLDVSQPVVAEKMTGTNGEAEFTGLVIGKTYMAVASKENFGAVNSESVQVSPRSQKILEIPFDIKEETVTLTVVSSQGTTISGATIRLMNYFTSEQIGTTQSSSTEGKALFTVRADKKIYFIVEANGYTKYFTSAAYVSQLKEKLIVMQKTSAQIKATIVGIYSGDSVVNTSGNEATTISEGTYLVKTIVQVPKGSFSEAGLHLRTGKETQNITNLVEEDGLHISNAMSSGRIIMGSTFSPPSGYDVDSKNLITAGNAKWVNSTWRNPTEGTYEMDAEITITETNPNAPLAIYYRAWAKGSSVLRYPTGTLTGNELYAPANMRILSSGATNLCEGNFCKSATVQALMGSEAGKKKYVTGTIEAKKDVEYLLSIDLVNYSGRAMPNSALVVEGISVDVNSVTVNGVTKTDNNSISVGTIGIDSPLKVQILFKATNSGASSIKVNVLSATQSELDLTYNINVKPNKKFTLDLIPKIIVPFIENTLYFEATDGNTPLNGVIVSLKNATTQLGTVTTNGEGIAQYNLAAPRAGTQVTITAKKEGYDNITLTKQIDRSILTLVPPTIEETIKIGETTSIQTQVIAQNNTAKTVKLVSATINGDVKNYLDIKFNDTINGTIIEQGKDKNYTLSMKLNSAALRITAPKDLTGTIVINTEVSGANQAFLNEIPVKIRLTFPGMLDSGKCLKVTPATVEFITTSAEISKTITLTNSCEAEGVKVDLRNIEAKLNETSKFGTVSIIGSGLNGTLTDKFSSLGDLLEKNSETEVVLKYTPTTSVESGKQNLVISITGQNLLDDGTNEKVTTSAKLDVTMNNLAKCVVVEEPADGILLDMAPWQQGYGRLMMSDFSSSLNSYQGFNNRSAPYGMNYMGNMGMSSYSNQAYGMGGYNNAYNGLNAYGGQGSMGMMGGSTLGQNNASYSQSAFIITNNCTSDIEIDLDVDSRLTVSEDTFTISAGSDNVVIVQPGYVLGKYTVKVNARLDGTKDAKKKIDDVKVTVRRLGDIDRDCIKTNVTKINLNSFVMKPQKYSAYNYCYDTGVQLARANVASINCSAPTGAGMQSLPYLQVGMESAYGNQYQLGGNRGYSSYSQYSSNGGVCGIGQCSLITGTNIRQRDVTQGDSGSIERVDFDVIPNPNYIAQRRLFNNQTGTAGLFQSVSDVRQWATETDARTDVYGNLNINYTNAYGAQECMEFPITIADMWRLGESIDSAVNWGDPNARPIDCQRKSSLDIIAYYSSRNPSGASAPPQLVAPGTPGVIVPVGGVVPESEYTGSNRNIFIYVADPSALRIGPMPNTMSQYYPQAVNTQYDYSYFQQQAQLQRVNTPQAPNQSGPSDDARANCGLSDSIKVITRIPAELTGGAIVSVESTHSGSLLKNSYGPNLMVQVDRSSMTANCVKLEIPIKASVTRMITMDSQELTWNLRILFTKQGYQYKGIKDECMTSQQLDTLPTDCVDKLRNKLATSKITNSDDPSLAKLVSDFLIENPLCTPYVSVDVAKQLLASAVVNEGCSVNPTEYGFDLISKAGIKNYNELVECTDYFCNDIMLQGFLLKRFSEIKTKVGALSNINNATSLVELYRASGTQAIKNCTEGDLNLFKSEEGGIVTQSYIIPKELLDASKVKQISDMSGSSISDMISILNTINDKNSVLLEFDYNSTFDAQYTDLGMTKLGNKQYMTLNGYIKLLEVLRTEDANNASNCNKDNTVCVVKYCGRDAKLDPKAFFGTIVKGRMVQGIIDKAHKDMDKNNIELIYAKNPRLDAVHKLAKFDSELTSKGLSKSLLLTTIPVLGASSSDVALLEKHSGLEGLRVEFIKTTNTTVGRYSVELDYDLRNDTKVIKATLGERKEVSEAPRAIDNVLLNSGFNFIAADSAMMYTDSINGIILKQSASSLSGIFYKRVPVKLTVILNGTEDQLSYYPRATGAVLPVELIKWYNSNGVTIGNDKLMESAYSIGVKSNGQAQTIKGIYYYPNGGDLGVLAGVTGGTINARAFAIAQFDSTQSIPGKNQQGIGIQSSDLGAAADRMTLDDVVKLVKDKHACISSNTIVWNENKIMSAN